MILGKNAKKYKRLISSQFLLQEQKMAELSQKIDRCLLQLDELFYANLLHDTIMNSSWLRDKSFSLRGGAANYSFIYILYRILNYARPQCILEMGMGQTTRLTSQYIAYANSQALLDVVENDFDWIKAYQPQLPQNERINIHQCDLEFFMEDDIECRKYSQLNQIVNDKKYDLIIIDGPLGMDQTLPRSNILDLIENHNLADDFIIIFDDAERIGEHNTIAKAIELLSNQNIESISFRRSGVKTQQIIASPNKSFVKYL